MILTLTLQLILLRLCFLVKSEKAVFSYKCTDFYHPGDEGGLAWNDPAINIEWPEIIGTIAFSVSGAMVGIKLGMDLFGVMVLGCCTACGGGLLRDVILGRLPAFLARRRCTWPAR